MQNTPSLSDLSRQRAELTRIMQKINFGKIIHLQVQNKEPVLEPRPEIIRHIKFGSENHQIEVCKPDFKLKSKVIELFEFFDELEDFMIYELQVKHGLPFDLKCNEKVA